MTVVIDGTTGISGVDGSASNPSYEGTDSNTGIFFPAADTIAFAEGGTEVARFDSAGNFGIGTSSPRSNSLTLASKDVVLSDGYGPVWGTTTKAQLAGYASGILQFFAGGPDERMRIDSSGNVGIGGTSAGNRLYVQRAAGSNFVGEVYLTDGTQWIIQNSNNSAGSYNPLFQTNDACLVYSSGTQNNGAFAIAQWSTSQRGIRIDGTGNFQFNSGYGSVATAYGCRAWVNFNGTANTNLSGTYSQSGTTVTVTATAHGLIAGNSIYADITTGTGVDGVYTVATVTDANTFTYTAGTSLTTSGNITLVRSTIRGSGNVSSVADNAVGDYTVNFSVAMPDANYSTVTGYGSIASGSTNYSMGVESQTASTVRVLSQRGDGVDVDSANNNVAIFR